MICRCLVLFDLLLYSRFALSTFQCNQCSTQTCEQEQNRDQRPDNRAARYGWLLRWEGEHKLGRFSTMRTSDVCADRFRKEFNVPATRLTLTLQVLGSQ